MSDQLASTQRVLLLGGTGASGLLTLQLLLSRSRPVTVYCRNPTKIPADLASNSLLTVVQGELSDTEKLVALLSDAEVVVSLLGPPSSSFQIRDLMAAANFFPSKLVFADTYRTILRAMKAAEASEGGGAKKIIVMGTISIVRPEDAPMASLARRFIVAVVWAIAHTGWRNMVELPKVFEEEAGGTNIDWTVFRLGMVRDGDGKPGDVSEGPIGKGGHSWSIKRVEIAEWIVKAVERNEGGSWGEAGRFPAISSKRKIKGE